MPINVTTASYRALAELRYQIRRFTHEGDAASLQFGLEPQQYFLMLALRGLPEGAEATVQTLAERLTLKHNSAVELIDRMEKRGYVRRARSSDDRRYVVVSLLPDGKKILEKVARQRITELRSDGTALANAILAVLGNARHPREKSRNPASKSAERS